MQTSCDCQVSAALRPKPFRPDWRSTVVATAVPMKGVCFSLRVLMQFCRWHRRVRQQKVNCSNWPEAVKIFCRSLCRPSLSLSTCLPLESSVQRLTGGRRLLWAACHALWQGQTKVAHTRLHRYVLPAPPLLTSLAP